MIDVPRIRTRLEAAMVDTVTIRRGSTSDQALDPVTGALSGLPAVIYTGPAKVRIRRGEPRATTGTVELHTAIHQVDVPHNVDVRPDDEIMVLGAAHDPTLVGTVFHVMTVELTTYNVERRCIVEFAKVADLDPRI